MWDLVFSQVLIITFAAKISTTPRSKMGLSTDSSVAFVEQHVVA